MTNNREVTNKREIVLFHSALGLRPGVLQFAEYLRDAGHTVHTPDLYDGEVFQDVASAVRKIQELGFDGLFVRSRDAVASLPSELIYAGFSNGGACAELLAATRPGASGAILISAPLPMRDLGWKVWPSTVPMQVHFSENDPMRNRQAIDTLGGRVRDSGAGFQEHAYPGSGHHFADPDWQGYNESATKLMLQNILEFLLICSEKQPKECG